MPGLFYDGVKSTVVYFQGGVQHVSGGGGGRQKLSVVLTDDADVWLAVWNGTGWVNQITATATGSGTTVQDVNRLLKNYTQVLKMMRKFNKGGMRGLRRGMLPF